MIYEFDLAYSRDHNNYCPLNEVKAGDHVLGYDLETKKNIWCPVKRSVKGGDRELIQVILSTLEHVRMEKSHEVLTGFLNVMAPIVQVTFDVTDKAGYDTIKTQSNGFVKIHQFTKFDTQKHGVRNLEIDTPDRNFYSNGILVRSY